jgi:hypothetical protein
MTTTEISANAIANLFTTAREHGPGHWLFHPDIAASFPAHLRVRLERGERVTLTPKNWKQIGRRYYRRITAR